MFFKISFQNKPRIHQSISKAQIFWNHGLKCLWYHKKVSLKVTGLCKCRNMWRTWLENSHFCVDYPVTLHNGTFDQLATKGTTFPKTWFLVLFKLELPFYAPISSVINISMLTNKIFTVFEAYFWRTTWKILHIKCTTCSCTCKNQELSGRLLYGMPRNICII